ncbi:CusA/CzcA family heavy metal efflux RND transporter, partial [Herbaspirillum sp. HC18]
YVPLLDASIRNRHMVALATGALVIVSGIAASRMGGEFIPSLDEGDVATHAMRIPGTSLTQAVDMQIKLEEAIRKVPEVREVFSKIGTAEVATDPMPPNVADTYIMLKPHAQWPDPSMTKAQLVSKIEKVVAE